MNKSWEIEIYKRADRHRNLHERDFGVTKTATVNVTNIGEAIQKALLETGLWEEAEGSYIIRVDFPHDT